jgi:glycerol-3-phosphate dehydrogenase
MSNPIGRDSLWREIQQVWDVIVIGGGIVGAGVFREAVRAGLKTLLLEAHDFSSGTSSRSSKMVHGGLRYLKNGQIKLTMDSVHERQRLLHEGKGLVDPLRFTLVSYRGDSPPGWVFSLGLIAYDALAMRWNHTSHSISALKEICPELNENRLVGGSSFYDAQTDDARLVLRVIQEGQRAGGTALNYARVAGLMRTQAGKVCGVQVQDQIGGLSVEIKAGVVINATGAWADDLRAHVGERPRLRQLRGSHLIFPREKLPVNDAISFLHPEDRRPVFAFSWEGATLVGTTDVDHNETMLTDPAISQAETDYLMAAVDHVFGCLGLTEKDVRSSMAGIRSVLDTGKADPSKESRDEILWDEHGLVTITGGKLTMFRHMAQKTLRFARSYLPEKAHFNGSSRALNALDDEALEMLAYQPQMENALLLRLLGRYGTAAPSLLDAAQSDELCAVADTPTLWAELRWAARTEQVAHLDDLLLRRTRLGSLLANGALDELARIRQICQPELGWEDARWQREEENYRNLWQRAYSLPQKETETA